MSAGSPSPRVDPGAIRWLRSKPSPWNAAGVGLAAVSFLCAFLWLSLEVGAALYVSAVTGFAGVALIVGGRLRTRGEIMGSTFEAELEALSDAEGGVIRRLEQARAHGENLIEAMSLQGFSDMRIRNYLLRRLAGTAAGPARAYFGAGVGGAAGSEKAEGGQGSVQRADEN